ncbi:deoxyguanosinetriphosphate triphosphohydrolase [Corynebacterium mendelii]|uniref:Deoxyguanosinetriphosphate triphosphohydrolase n=1 Tax=Corynebacterium mendelii TaxID=2765362 RepID=A0A939E060_9CORY|nr:deoxyguanosinetriphosphate triphosphohydrolase [Corynebacterium mendelii]MBN9644248.1 deoxyguanosinetriphosphate triphosphohydrolase [Corynebacterium mendelii]
MANRYNYAAADVERLFGESAKGAAMVDGADHRGAFARDRARVLHSAAFRRLADKTQVVGPRDGDTPRTRLTHSLEVAQIARAIGEGVGADGDLCELAGLVHDIGHPPYGHNGENELNILAQDCGGFEGNAQTLRILTFLEPKILTPDGESEGLNLTRASLDASCKYPWGRLDQTGSPRRKYGAYDTDLPILHWVRQGHENTTPCLEAQCMDWADDVAYCVHDVEDGILAGRITLKVLWDFVELAALADRGAAAFGGDPADLLEAADRLRQLDTVARAADFDGSLAGLATLKKLTSELVGRYVGAAVAATVERAGHTPLGRMHGRLVRPPQAQAEVVLLKTIAVLYVMSSPSHTHRQDRQRERLARVYDYLALGTPGTLDPVFAAWWTQADTDADRCRVIIDQIASLTETRLERLARQATDIASFYG